MRIFENKYGKRLITGVLLGVLVFVLSFSTSFGAEDPNVTIVNPLNGSTVYSNSLLISVKVTAPETIRINLYKQVKNDENENPVAISTEEWNKHQSELREISLGSETLTSTSINILNGFVMEPATFSSSNNLAFFTKKVDNLSRGVYKVRIETLDQDKQQIFSNENVVFIKEKKEQPVQADVFENSQKGTVNFLQNLLRSIFKK